MICFVRRSTIEYDIRLRKYISACQDTSTRYLAITWDRLNNCQKVYDGEKQLKIKAPYGGGITNFFGLIAWCFFVYWNLLCNFNKFKVIHACDFDAVVLVLPFKFLGKKIIFDIYDSSRFMNLERYVSRIVDVLILPNRMRLKQIGINEEEIKRFIEVENVPQFQDNVDFAKHKRESDCISISYVGTFRKKVRGLENVLKMVENDKRIELHIAGAGDGFEEVISKACERCDRIHYHGVVEYEVGLEIMGQSDFIMALYYLSAPVHKYASPNKFYESLFLGVPIITSKNTLVGSQVDNNNTGYTIDDNLESLESLFNNYGSTEFEEDYKSKRLNCIRLWQQRYASYYDTKFLKEYIGSVQELSNNFVHSNK